MGAFVLVYVKDRKVMDIFDKGVMVYEGRDSARAYWFTFDELEDWEVSHENGHDTIEFLLLSGQRIIKDSFEADRAYRTLYGLVKEKERRYIKAQKDREKPLSIPDALSNIRKSFMKK